MNLAKLPSFVDIHEDVSKALNENIPIVALESTIITHGMPVSYTHLRAHET